MFIIAFLNDNSYEITAPFLYWMVDIIPGCIVTLDICFRKKYTETELIELLLIVGTVQGLLAAFTFIYPEFKSFLLSKMLLYGQQDLYLDLARYRIYGISANMTFSAPIVQSMLGMMAVYLAVKKNMKYMLYFPLLAFSAVINARISIVVMLVGIVAIYVSFLTLDFKRIIRTIIIVCVSIIALRALLYWMKISAPETYTWIDTGTNEIISFLKGDSTGFFNYVTNEEKYVLPSGLSFIFGKGILVLGGWKYGIASDIGWINDIWKGGIVYSIIIYIFYGRMILDIYRFGANQTEVRKYLSIFFVGIFLITNFKGALISSNEVMTVIFLVFLFITSVFRGNRPPLTVQTGHPSAR
jgi:hypothetical protein